MRILLAQNSLYYPAHGGGDKSNRLLMEALAARGHDCAVVARISVFDDAARARYLEDLAAREVAARTRADGVVEFKRAGVAVQVVTAANQRSIFLGAMESFRPDVILTSTDDPTQLLLEQAFRHPTARIVYLARATLALPFGPDCAFPSDSKTERIRSADLVVGVSQYVADYIRRYAGTPAAHVPISLLEPEDWPALGCFDNEFVTMVNPCAVKGIAIFLALADAFPAVPFAAVPTWGANAADRAALAARPNVRLLDPVDDINRLLERTRVLLIPSVWAEARSRMVLEAMLRGVPVMAANVGGIPEAKMGVPYLLRVNPITHYRPQVDEQMVPVAEVPPQDIGPWHEALSRLLTDRAHYDQIARASRSAALEYAANLSVEPFERLVEGTPRKSARAAPSKPVELSPEKRRLLALRLRKKAPPESWFPYIGAGKPRLFWFPHAGGGATSLANLALDSAVVCPVRLPGRESRLAEAPFEDMEPLVRALAAAIERYLDHPYAFFGHSMGAAVAFELARRIRERGWPLPRLLIASAARAPRFRRNHVPGPDPSAEELMAEVNLPDHPETRRALLPALEADARLYRRYVYREDDPLPFPIRAYGGVEDPNIHREHLEAWREQTTGRFAVRLFAGGHFYYQTGAVDFRAALEEDLQICTASDAC
jgi:surfactin synthase thioesterase subunit/glycosyltransferase involved in cell wall biosynthesis